MLKLLNTACIVHVNVILDSVNSGIDCDVVLSLSV